MSDAANDELVVSASGRTGLFLGVSTILRSSCYNRSVLTSYARDNSRTPERIVTKFGIGELCCCLSTRFDFHPTVFKKESVACDITFICVPPITFEPVSRSL